MVIYYLYIQIVYKTYVFIILLFVIIIIMFHMMECMWYNYDCGGDETNDIGTLDLFRIN